MKSKTKRILAIVVAVIFVIGVVLAIVFSSRSKYEVSADQGTVGEVTVTTWGDTELDYSSGALIASVPNGSDSNSGLHLNVSQTSITNVTISLTYNGLVNGSQGEENRYYITANQGTTAKGFWFINASYGFTQIEFNSTNITYIGNYTGTAIIDRFSIQLWTPTGNGTTGRTYINIAQYYATTTDNGVNYTSSYWNENITNDSAYDGGYNQGEEQGYQNGYNQGLTDGYNSGYNAGYDKGASEGLTNPIALFISPIDSFLSTDIFGTISIGDIMAVIIFIMVAIIFIKMFAGG